MNPFDKENPSYVDPSVLSDTGVTALSGTDFKLVYGNLEKVDEAVAEAQIYYKDGVAYEPPPECTVPQPCPDGQSLQCMPILPDGYKWVAVLI